jgi:nucleoside-diphosphate-sugar epimerase
MKILVTGNMGYVGPSVVNQLRASYPGAKLVGFDIGYFGNCVTGAEVLPECRVDAQYFGDMRQFPEEVLTGVDAIVHLAGISNDPIGNRFEEVTLDINYRASVELARKAREAGVRFFVFASSCSMYGSAEGSARTEMSALNPLTAYAKSKVFTERDLEGLASGDFRVTSLRFSTACGWSDRLRRSQRFCGGGGRFQADNDPKRRNPLEASYKREGYGTCHSLGGGQGDGLRRRVPGSKRRKRRVELPGQGPGRGCRPGHARRRYLYKRERPA